MGEEYKCQPKDVELLIETENQGMKWFVECLDRVEACGVQVKDVAKYVSVRALCGILMKEVERQKVILSMPCPRI